MLTGWFFFCIGWTEQICGRHCWCADSFELRISLLEPVHVTPGVVGHRIIHEPGSEGSDNLSRHRII